MPKYEVIEKYQNFVTYMVEAKTEQEAIEKARDIKPEDAYCEEYEYENSYAYECPDEALANERNRNVL